MTQQKIVIRTARDLSVSACPASCRMAVVEAVPDGDGVDFRIYPVVCLQVVMTRELWTECNAGTRPPSDANQTEEVLRRMGWAVAPDRAETRAVVAVGGELLPHTSLPGDYPREVVAMPWPAEEDECRLAEARARLAAKIHTHTEDEPK